MKKRFGTPVFALSRLAIAVAGCFCVAPVHANPVGAQLASGSATFAAQGNTLAITNTPGTIINWQGFSIGAAETTRFNQASAASAVLNRVVSNNPSQLLGQLQSNGRVFLINPAGILVGAGARVDTAGFVASTLNLSNADFLAGRFNFTATPGAGKVENHGTISTPSGGSVYLVGAQVENHGIISAPNGEVLLAAGQTAQLIDTATPGVRVELTADTEQALNVGQILAESGRIGMVGAIVKNSGRVSASSVTSEGGRVFLKATRDAYVEQAGSIEATGTRGGTVEVLGKRVALTDQASIDASGTQGGGAILVGGDYQGKNNQIQNATISYVGQEASLKADATQSGNGGKVIVWADDITRFYGGISARGGSQSGNGGFVEVSGKRYLDFQGMVSTAAAQGLVGTLLLDPSGITIATGPSSPDMSASSPFAGSAFSSSVLGVATLQTALAGNNVLVDGSSWGSDANGSVTVATAVSWANTNQLTLRSGSSGGVAINEAITAASGALKIEAGTGGVTQSAGGVIETATLGISSSGDVVLDGASNRVATLAADLSSFAGKNLRFNNASGFAVGAASGVQGIATTGDVTLKSGAGVTQTHAITAAGLEIVASGNVILGQLNEVGTLAASVTGAGQSFIFENRAPGAALVIGSVGATTGVSANGNVIVRENTSGNIAVNENVASSSGDVMIGIASGPGGVNVAAGKAVNGNNVQIYTSGGPIAINGDVTGTASANIDAQAGAIGTGAAGLVTAPLIHLQTSAVASGAIGASGLPFRTSSPNGVGPATLNIGASGYGPSAVYLSHRGDLSIGSGVTQSTAIVDLSLVGAGNLLTVTNDSPFNAADITLSADRMTLLGGNAIVSGGGVWLRPYTPGRNIDLGSATDLASALELSDDELGNVNAPGKLRIGDLGAGTLNISASIAPANASVLVLEAGSGVTQAAGGTIAVGQLLVNSLGSVALDTASNSVGTIAARVGDASHLNRNFRFANSASLDVGTVAGVAGISTQTSGAYSSATPDGVIALTSGGDLTQSAAISGKALKAVGASVNLTLANAVGAIAGNVTGASGTGFRFTSSGAMAVESIDGLASVVNNNGSSTGYVELNSGAGITQAAGTSIVAAGTLKLTANGNVALTGSNGVSALTANLSSGSLSLVDGWGLSLTGITTVNNFVDIESAALITVSSPIDVGSGANAVIKLKGGGIDYAATATRAEAIALQASDSAQGITLSSGSVLGSSTDTKSIKLVTDKLTLAGGRAQVANAAGNEIQITANTAGASIGVGSGGTLTIADTSDSTFSASDLVIGSKYGDANASGAIAVNAAISRAGRLALLSGAGISQATASAISANAVGVIAGGAVNLNGSTNSVGNLAIQTNSGAIGFANGGALTIAALTGGGLNPTTIAGVRTGGGNIQILAGGGIALAAPVVTDTTASTVTLSSAGGAITDSSSGVAVTANGLDISAYSGIGSLASPLKTKVSRLKAVNAMVGDVAILNKGALTTDDATTIRSPGNLSLKAQSPLTIGAAGVIAVGDVTLVAGATGAGATTDNLTINGPVASSNGSLLLSAGNSIGGSGPLSAPGGITRTANLNPAAPLPLFPGSPPPAPAAPPVPLPASPLLPSALAGSLQATQGQTVNELDNAQSQIAPTSLFVTSPLVAPPPPPLGTLPQQASPTFVGGVVGGESPNTFGSTPGAPSGAGDAPANEEQNGRDKRKFGQCVV